MTLGRMSRGVLALSLFACATPEAKQPNPMRPIDERRAIPIMAQAFKDESETPSEGREIHLATGKTLRIDVASAGHKYGVAYVTASDMATLDAKTDLPPHSPTGDLPIVQGTGTDADAVVLILFADDYTSDDLSGEQHESTTITSEKKLARDVRDFIVQAKSRNLP